MGENIVMSLKHISKTFPGVRALHDISFDIKEGEVLALLGENGAGKSTLIKCLTGAHEPTEGSIELFGKKYGGLTPAIARENGISAVYQEFNLVPDLPIVENVFMGNNPGNGIIVDYKQMLKQCKEVFEKFGIDIDPEDDVSSLSPAMMQIVEIAKATMLNAKILILDEPTAPLTAKEIGILFRIIRDLKEHGGSIVYISHRLEEIFEICDRAVIIRDGEKVGETQIQDTNRAELIKIMIGRELTRLFPLRKANIGKEVSLSLKEVSGNGDKDISFDVHKGEILGVAGLVGAGRTELMGVIFCDAPKEKGTIIVNGKELKGTSPWHAITAGISYLPEDRKRHGLLLDKSISANLSLASIKKYCKYGIINKQKEYECVDYYCKKFRVKTPDYENETQYLSGGNQQKVIVGKWLATDSDIVIFDEPTRGIDVGAKYEIYEIIFQLADEGKSIIVVSSEFEELIGIADRIVVMSEGHLVGEVEKKDFDKELLLDMASGQN
ncbi:MAG: sugar ABC transporter ATP-binding protein [Lachnospiraceae bacterium]|jgi:ribose transport system ATP-binding protein